MRTGRDSRGFFVADRCRTRVRVESRCAQRDLLGDAVDVAAAKQDFARRHEHDFAFGEAGRGYRRRPGVGSTLAASALVVNSGSAVASGVNNR